MAEVQQPPLPPPPPSWVLDLNSPGPTKPKNASIAEPPGFSSNSLSKRGTSSSKQSQVAPRKQATGEEMSILKMKKAWELALAPAKQLPMNAIGMWMTGNTLQIFSIFMVFTLFKTPLQALMNTNSTFVRLESAGTKSQMLIVKLAYIATNLLALSLGIYKIHKMGLLPTTRSDWLAWESRREPLERAFPAFGV